MRQKHSANARPAMLGRDVQVLEPDASAALPRGEGRVEHRKAGRPTLELRDQRLRRWARSKQRLGEQLRRPAHLIAGIFVLRQLADPPENQLHVGRLGRADLDCAGHGRRQ